MQLLAVVLLIALVLATELHAQSTDSTDVEKDGKAEISWPCTAKCAAWWKCRLFGFFLRKCPKPAGCDCSKFAWER